MTSNPVQKFALLATFFCLATAANSASLGNSVGVYVFPADGQSEEQQVQDDATCFNWAKGQTGYDPVNPTVVTAQPQDTGPSGSRLRGAARGAVGGAISVK